MNGAPEEASLLERVRADLVRHPGAVDVARVSRLLREAGQVVGAGAMLDLTARLRDHVEGLGPLQPLVAEGVTDLLVNGDGTVWVEDSTGLRRDALRLRPEEARELAVRLATAGVGAWTTRCPGPMRTCPRASACTRCCRRCPPPAP